MKTFLVNAAPARRLVRSAGFAVGLLSAAAVCLTGAPVARAQSVSIEPRVRLPLGLQLEARVRNGKVDVSVSRGGRSRASRSRPEQGRPTVTRRPASRRSRAPVVVRAPRDAGLPSGADQSCLAALEGAGVPFVGAGAVRGIATPIEVTGPIGGIRLISRKSALMDCELAMTLADAAPAMRELGVTGLAFSSTYNYRTVKGSSNLSGHAFGLAIDVHEVETATMGRLDIERDYAHDRGRWSSYGRGVRSVSSCVGSPATESGRLLRALACQLASRSTFHLVITPDDNYDHRNHLHLEAYPGRSKELLSARSSSFFRGRRSRR
jgi:hypothetical protein